MDKTSIEERYVQRLDRRGHTPDVPYDRDGFLDLDGIPDAIAVGELVGATESYVLLAPGGVGKTTVLSELCRREHGLPLDLAILGPGELRTQIHAAEADRQPRYLDALDEAARLQPSTLRFLKREFPDRLTWRLSSRPAGWDGGFPGTVRRYRLLPLTRNAARSMLSAIGVADEFLDRLVAAGLGRLSATPLLLNAVARQWLQDGRLPSSRDEALDHIVDLLIAEQSPEHVPAFSSDLRRRTAGRLAAMMVFARSLRFTAHRAGVPGALIASELPSVPDPDRPDTAIGPDLYREVLATALFHAADDDSVTFQHHEYAEYLAARYVADRRPSAAQVASLLGSVQGVVPTSLIDLAAWIAARSPEHAAVIVPPNALALAQTEAYLSPAVRALVVAALLEQARDPDIPPQWALDLKPLVHSELEQQLADEIRTGPPGDLGTWWIGRLAFAGECGRLIPELLTIALNPMLPSWSRRPAIAAIARLGEEPDRARLSPLLELDETEDPDDELFAAVIDEFYGREMDTAELLGVLRTPRAPDLIGSYRKFLWELPGRVPDTDFSRLAAWVAERHVHDPWSWRRPWGELAQAIDERRRPQPPVAAQQPRSSPGAHPETVKPADENLLGRISDALAAARQDVRQWWTVCAGLAGMTYRNVSVFDVDLTARPGWALLDDSGRNEVLDQGITYLSAHSPEPAEWAGRRSVALRPMLRDSAGVYLLATLATHASRRFVALPHEVLAAWAPAVGAAWAFGHQDLLGHLTRQLSPDLQDAIAEAVLGILDRQNSEDATLGWSPVNDVLAGRLLPAISTRLRSGRYRPELATQLLDQVVRLDPGSAVALCRDLEQTEIAAAYAHLVRLDPHCVVDRFIDGRPVSDQSVLDLEPDKLDDLRLSELARILFARFPPAADQPHEDAGTSPGSVHFLRSRTVELLADRALVHDLERLAGADDPATRYFIRSQLRRARLIAADRSPAHLTPPGLMQLLARSDIRLVRDDRDLQEVLLEHLGSLQHTVTHQTAYRDLWDGDRPKGEDDISDWVGRALGLRLGQGALVDREVQVKRIKRAGVGTRMDLIATATTATTGRTQSRVVVEAKLDTNPGLGGALRSQLVDSYLRATDRRHGIYLVYWTGNQRRWPGPEQLLDELRAQAAAVQPEFDVRVFVLDLSKP